MGPPGSAPPRPPPARRGAVSSPSRALRLGSAAAPPDPCKEPFCGGEAGKARAGGRLASSQPSATRSASAASRSGMESFTSAGGACGDAVSGNTVVGNTVVPSRASFPRPSAGRERPPQAVGVQAGARRPGSTLARAQRWSARRQLSAPARPPEDRKGPAGAGRSGVAGRLGRGSAPLACWARPRRPPQLPPAAPPGSGASGLRAERARLSRNQRPSHIRGWLGCRRLLRF